MVKGVISMARVRIYDTQAKKFGTVSEQFVDGVRFVPEAQYKAPSQPAQSGGFLTNLIGSLISPFKRTAQRGVGAVQEIGLDRAGKVDEANRLIKEAQKRMMAGDTSPQVKAMLDQAEQLARAGSQDTIASRNQEVLTDPLQIAKDSAAMLSWGVPAKGIGNIGKVGTRAIGGAAGGFGYSPETSVEGLLSSTVGGAGASVLTGAVLDKLFPGKVPTKEAVTDIVPEEQAGISRKDLRALRKQMGMVSGDINTKDPNWLKKSIERQKNLQTLTTTGSDDMAKALQITNQMTDLQTKANAILESSANTVDANDLRTFLESYVKDKVSSGMLDETLLQSQIDDIVRKSAGGQVTGKVINNVRTSLPQVSQAYAKAGAGTSQNVAAQATAKELERALKEALNVLEPEASKILSEMAPMYDLLPALQKSAKSSLRVPILGDVTVLKPAIQSATDVATRAGRPLSGVSQVGQVAQKPIRDALGAVLGKTPPALPGALTQTRGQPEAQPTQPMPSAGMQQPTAGTGQGQPTDILSMLGLDAQSLMLLSALPVKEQNAVLTELIGGQIMGTGKEPTATQQERKKVVDGIALAKQYLASGQVKTGKIGAPLEELKSVFSAGDQSTIEFNRVISNLRASIAKARGGTSFTANEEALLNTYAPKIGDSLQQLQTKLEMLSQISYD